MTQTGLPVWTTFGVPTDMMKTFRPGDGRMSSCARSTAEATEALADSISGVSAVTVIVSSMPPRTRVASTNRKAEIPTMTPERTKGAKPASSAATL